MERTNWKSISDAKAAIGAILAGIGVAVSPLARQMVTRLGPAANYALLAVVTLIGLAGVALREHTEVQEGGRLQLGPRRRVHLGHLVPPHPARLPKCSIRPPIASTACRSSWGTGWVVYQRA